jgi:hypothetical protein
MSLASRLRIDSIGRLLTVAFYAVTGVILFAALPFANFPPHVAIMGILSLITAYGLFVKRSWSLYPVIMLFLIITTFALYMIAFLFTVNLILEAGAAVYLILTWLATIYVSTKRKMLTL